MTTTRRRLIAVVAVFLIITVAFLALEGSYRLYKRVQYGMVDYPDVVTVGIFQRDSLYGWVPVRNFRSERDIPEKIRKNDRIAGPHFHKQITFNSLGYRGPEVAVEKEPGTYRIVALGGSTTLNLETDDPKTWTAILERRLQNHKGFMSKHGVRNVEVINAGVSRWRTREGLLLLRQEILRLHPDLILASFNWNDAGEWAVHRYDPDQPIPDETPWWASIKLLHNIRVRYLAWKFDESEYASWTGELQRDRYWVTAYTRNLLAMRQAASDIGAEFLLVNLPGLCREHATAEEYAFLVNGPLGGKAAFRWYAELKTFMSGLMNDLMRDHGMRAIDVSAAFEPFSGRRRLALFVDAIHYSEVGSEAVAGAIFQTLMDDRETPEVGQPAEADTAGSL